MNFSVIRYVLGDSVKYKILDDKLNKVNDELYDDVLGFQNGLMAVKKDNLWGFLDDSFKLVINHKFYEVGYFEENGLCPVQVTEKPGSWALINKTGEKISKAPKANESSLDDYGYYMIYPFLGKETTIAKYYGTYVLIDLKGNIVSPKYAAIAYSKISNMYLAKTMAKEYVIDKNQNVLFEPKDNYDELYYPDIENGRILAVKGSETLFLDFAGNEILPSTYRNIYEYSEGLACFETNNGLYGFLDLDGNIAIDAISEEVTHFSQGLAAVKRDGKYYYVDKKGKTKFGQSFLDAGDFHKSGFALVKLNNENKAIIDTNGKVKIEFKSDTILDEPVYGPVISIKKDGKIGLLNINGGLQLFNNISEIEINDKHPVNRFTDNNGQFGYIHDNGKIIFPAIFHEASQVNKDGDAIVEAFHNEGGDIKLHINVDTKAEHMLKYEYKYGNFDPVSGLACVQIGSDAFVYMNKKFEIDFDKIYTWGSDFVDGYAIIRKNEEYTVLDVNGNDISKAGQSYHMDEKAIIIVKEN